MNNTDIPEGISIASGKKISTANRGKMDWIAVKREYLADKDKNLQQVAEEMGASLTTTRIRAQREGWAKDKSIIYKQIRERSDDIFIEKQAQIAARHALIAKLVQKTGIEAIKNKKVRIKSAKDALEYVVEGVRMEREAEGLDRQTPQVVNIISQQQGVIDKYKQ